MTTPRTPATEPYYGPIYGDYIARNLAFIAGTNPQTEARMRRTHGRYLAGFGGESPSGEVGYDPNYQPKEGYELEVEDDTFGSGIFDPGGRAGTSNPRLGVFASHYSLPGYIAREVPFTVAQDVRDITDDADVVHVPGGGMAYVERSGHLAPPRLGPSRPAQVLPPAPLPSPNYARRVPSRPSSSGRVPQAPIGSQLPSATSYVPVPTSSIVFPQQTPVPVARASHPVSAAAPDDPSFASIVARSTVNVGATRSVPVSGFGLSNALQHVAAASNPGGVFGWFGRSYGADATTTPATTPATAPAAPSPTPDQSGEKKPATAGELLFAGLAVGVVGMMFVKAMSPKKSRTY